MSVTPPLETLILESCRDGLTRRFRGDVAEGLKIEVKGDEATMTAQKVNVTVKVESESVCRQRGEDAAKAILNAIEIAERMEVVKV